MSESCVQEEACEEAEKEKRSALYVFPSIPAAAAVPPLAETSQQLMMEIKRDAIIIQPQPLAIEALDVQAIDSIAQGI